MAIKIFNIKSNNSYVYSDIHLDLELQQRDGNKPLSTNVVQGNDLLIDTDTTAIRNSLVNLLTTNPGQRPLNPTFGISLNRYIGLPNTTNNANSIGNDIKSGIERFEPRVEIVKIIVNSDPDRYLYQIAIILNILGLKEKAILLTGSLSQEKGFNIININDYSNSDNRNV